MTDWTSLAQRLKSSLRLNLEPVGVRIFRHGEPIPPAAAALEREAPVKSYCQAITLAARGESVCGGARKLGCVLGTSILGLEDDPEPLLDDSVLEKYGVGLFDSEEASRRSVEGATRNKPGESAAVLTAPLAAIPVDPQLVVLEVDPEQTMWLLYAANYEQGGRQFLPQSGGVAGGCSDITLLPLAENTVNVTFLGLGCRLKSAIPRDHLLFGLPAGLAAATADRLEKLAKPMGMLVKARGE